MKTKINKLKQCHLFFMTYCLVLLVGRRLHYDWITSGFPQDTDCDFQECTTFVKAMTAGQSTSPPPSSYNRGGGAIRPSQVRLHASICSHIVNQRTQHSFSSDWKVSYPLGRAVGGLLPAEQPQLISWIPAVCQKMILHLPRPGSRFTQAINQPL